MFIKQENFDFLTSCKLKTAFYKFNKTNNESLVKSRVKCMITYCSLFNRNFLIQIWYFKRLLVKELGGKILSKF